MSKFKSFASQASFRDYQLKAPDEAAKIKEETDRVIRGKERAQNFLEGNNALYLQAQKLAQQQEEMSRETNFRLESENRKFYRQALDRDFRIQIENDRNRPAQQQQQQIFKELSALSQTAAKLFVDFNTKITENQTNSNTVNTIIAGTTFEENLAIQGMVDNLTEAEFAQQNFIQQMVKEGKDVKALWTLYNNRNTRGFIENAGVIQNTSYSLAPYLSEVLKNLDSELTPEQKRLQVETAYREWLANSFKDANGKQLNPKLVANIGAPIFGQAYNQLMGEFDKEEAKANSEKWKQDRSAGYDVAFANGGIGGVLEKAKGREQLGYVTDWALTRLKAGTMSWQDAEALLTHPIIDENGKETNWETKHPSDSNIGRLLEGIKESRRGLIQQTNLEKTELRQQLDTNLINYYNEVAADRSISRADRLGAEQIIRQAGLPDYESPVFTKFFVEQEDSVLNDAAAKEVFTNEYNNGTLTVEKIQMTKNVSQAVKDPFIALAQKYDAGWKKSDLRTSYKDQLNSLLSSDRRIIDKKDWTVQRMQDKYLKKLDKKVRELGVENAPEAFTAVFAEAQALLQGESIKNGQFTQILENQSDQQKQAAITIQRKKNINEAFLNPNFRTDPTILSNALGAGFIYQSYDDVKAGKPIPAEFKQIAARLGMGMTPLDALNWAVRPAKLDPITVSGYDAEILKNRPPIANLFPTNNTIERANYTQNNSLSTAPRRGAFNVVQYVTNDPRFKDRAFGPIVYDEHGHGGANMHVHYEFATKEQALAAKALYESKGFRISSFMRPQDTGSAHSKGFAIDVAPPTTLPYNEQAELAWIRSVNAVIGYDPTQVN